MLLIDDELAEIVGKIIIDVLEVVIDAVCDISIIKMMSKKGDEDE